MILKGQTWCNYDNYPKRWLPPIFLRAFAHNLEYTARHENGSVGRVHVLGRMGDLAYLSSLITPSWIVDTKGVRAFDECLLSLPSTFR